MRELNVYAEVGEDKGCLLFIFDPPGMLVRANSFDAALDRAPGAVNELFALLNGCWQPCPGPGETPNIKVAEVLHRRGKVANGNTSVTFQRDLVPLQPEVIIMFLKAFEGVRRHLLELKAQVPGDAYNYKSMPHRKTIEEQLRHIAVCQGWYLSQLWNNLPRLPRSQDVWHKLELNWGRVIEKLLSLCAEDLALVVRTKGEVWTCQKILRPLFYHEQFHLGTIKRDLKLYFESTGGNALG